MKHVAKRIEEEETKITSRGNAIYNLEMAIPDGRKIPKAHDENLSTFKTLRERISGISSLISWDTKPEETSEAFCDELKECFVMPAVKNVELIQDQIDLITAEARRLCDKILQLEMDSDMWRFSRKLSQSALDHLKSTRDTLEEDLKLAGSAFGAFWKIPTNVWVAIFDCVQREEMDDYLETVDFQISPPGGLCTFSRVLFLAPYRRYRASTVENDLCTAHSSLEVSRVRPPCLFIPKVKQLLRTRRQPKSDVNTRI